MESVNPPRYSTLSHVTLPSYLDPGDFDISSLDHGRPGEGDSRQAFDFCIEKNPGSTGDPQPWATLRLLSTVPAALPVRRPRYIGGENVEGSVMLDLKRPRTVTSIAVVLRGSMVTSSLSEFASTHTFLEVVHPIWNKTTSTGKLQGSYEWQFSFPFPIEVTSVVTGSKQRSRTQSSSENTYLTPQTVTERGVYANVAYEVILKVTTAGLLSVKHRATASVLYIPFIRPPPLCPLRALAYVSGLALPGPEDDPDGWQMVQRMELRVSSKDGFDPTAITLECTAYIAKPTVYTRGTSIPCYLIYKNRHVEYEKQDRVDSTSLATNFAKQRCISLGITQQVHHQQDPRQTPTGRHTCDYVGGLVEDDERSTREDERGTAVWWTPQISGKHFYMEGGIHVDIGHLPSCETPFLRVSHAVTISVKLSHDLDVSVIPQTTKRVRHGRKGSAASAPPVPESFADFPIKIATAHAEQGPLPLSYTPLPPKNRRSVPYDSKVLDGDFGFL
ncbi:hypothetical protein D9611_013852 [Ephemerocybe angulata]|uniref:Arrestin-like N-terminal domain-containing protein n=1 Tax=Ephemerocybe angulata TaxID=980116 RepID=A0A8H5BTH7_9AGAR|nr:hypothetical protein D9611_013852 [Tulosesus angulatus]